MKAAPITVRVPDSWVGRVGSASVRGWLADYFQRPSSLPPDPGPGGGYLRLSLPKRAVKVFAAAVADSPSAALRRLIASRLSLPAGRGGPALATPTLLVPARPAPAGVDRVSATVPVVKAEPIREVEAGSTGLDAAEYWAWRVWREGLNLLDVPARLRPRVAWLCPNALCGSVPAWELFDTPPGGFVPAWQLWGTPPGQVLPSPSCGSSHPVHVAQGSWCGDVAWWRWLVVGVAVVLLLWLFKPWAWLRNSKVAAAPASGLPARFREWVPVTRLL